MTEKRTAAQIRAYCEAATGGEWFLAPLLCGPQGQGVYHMESGGQICEVGDPYPRGDNNPQENMEFIANARTDLPAVLDAAVKLRHLATLFGCLAQLIPNADAYLARIEQDLAETAWLEGSEDGST